MGGQRSEVRDTTTSVVMEAATWNGPNIQRKSTRLALLTVLFGMLSGAASTSLLALINGVLSQRQEGGLDAILLPFAGLTVAALLMRMGSQLVLNRLQHGILLDLRLWLGRHLLSSSLR